MKPLILIDGSGWLFRAYHALPPLTNSRGEPTGAVFGMHNMLRKLLKDYAPERICVVFDPAGKTFRDTLYADYKANRTQTPEDLAAQYPAILELIDALGLPCVTVDGVEADDVIGTLAQAAAARGEDVLIVTSDKDMAQLVDGRIALLDTMKNQRLDAKGVVEKFGVPPERIVDYLALMGDSSDNIPGIPGVGPKTAAKWLAEYGSLDAIIAHAADIKGKVGDNLRAHLDRLPLARTLATIRRDVALPLTLDDLRPRPPDTARLAALFRRLEFTRLLGELADDAPAVPARTAAAAAPSGSPPTQPIVVLDDAGLEALAEALDAAELISFDTETDSLDAHRARAWSALPLPSQAGAAGTSRSGTMRSAHRRSSPAAGCWSACGRFSRIRANPSSPSTPNMISTCSPGTVSTYAASPTTRCCKATCSTPPPTATTSTRWRASTSTTPRSASRT